MLEKPNKRSNKNIFKSLNKTCLKGKETKEMWLSNSNPAAMPGGIYHRWKKLSLLSDLLPSILWITAMFPLVKIKVLPMLAEEPLNPTVASHCTVHHLENLHYESLQKCVSSPKAPCPPHVTMSRPTKCQDNSSDNFPCNFGYSGDNF